jgi:hypothetical protein
MQEEPSIESKLEQKPDLSQKAVIVLVVLTVLISVLGTVAVLNEVGNVRGVAVSKAEPQPAIGQVKLEIKAPNIPQSDSTTGRVALNILPSKQNTRVN